MPGLPLSISRYLRIVAVILFAFLCAAMAGARSPNLAKYPLRVHVLSSDETHMTPRMSPAESVVCDEIAGMLDSISPNQGGPISISGISSDPCSLHPEMITGRLLNIGDEDPEFSGEGRGDLVSPPTTTQGVTFKYDNCVRVRVHPGFQSLPARWKKQGKRLEVLIPSDDIPVSGRPLPPVKCSFDVTLHDYIYLLLKDGRLIKVSQEVYMARPALRDFLSGRPETIQRRLEEFTVPAHPAQ
jgi:hypothetical protein